MNKPKVAISIGDVNGVGLEVTLKSHDIINQICEPLYCVDSEILEAGARLLGVEISRDFEIFSIKNECKFYHKNLLQPATISKESGEYSFASFKAAVNLAEHNEVSGVATLPIHKYAWNLLMIF